MKTPTGDPANKSKLGRTRRRSLAVAAALGVVVTVVVARVLGTHHGKLARGRAARFSLFAI